MPNRKLRFLVLNHLACSPNSGYGLIKEIEKATGWKPSYGSIYPLLEHLKEEGLVTCKDEGRKKVYSLTKEGKDAQSSIAEHHKNLVQKMTETNSVMCHLLGMKKEESEEMMTGFMSAIMSGDKTFREMMPASNRMKQEFWRLYKQNLLKKNKKKVIKIFDEATERLQRIR